MMSRTSGTGPAVLATLTLFIGFVAGSLFAPSEAITPPFGEPDRVESGPGTDSSVPNMPHVPLSRELARVASAAPAAYRVSETELTQARARIDVAPTPPPQGTARITGRVATIHGEPLAGVVVVAALRPEADPYGKFSDELGQGNPIDPSLDDALTDRAESWARTRGGSYRAVTGADGSYAIEGLVAGQYRLSAYHTGYVLEPTGGGSYVESGGTRDLVARPVVEFTAEVRMPDGSQPSIATIRVKRDRGSDSIRWTPDRPVIRLPAADGSAEALTEFVTGPGYGTNAPARYRSPVIRLSEQQLTLDFRLEPQVGIYGRVLETAGIPARHVTLLDLSRDPTVSAEAFAASATRTQLSGSAFEFMGLDPGRYALGLLDHNGNLHASATVTVRDGLVEQNLEVAAPSRADSIRVLCQSPAGLPLYDVQFRYAVFSDNGSSSGSVSQPVRDVDGAYWLPTAAIRNFEDSGASSVVRITAEHPRFGRCHGELATGARELTLRFAEPCKLNVTVPGYAQSPYRGSLKVQVVAEAEKQPADGLSRHVSPDSEIAEILADETAGFSNLRPGTWNVHLILVAQRYGGRTIASTRVDLAAPAQQVSLSIPPLYDVVVQGPMLEPRAHVWLQKMAGEGSSSMHQISFHDSGRLDEQRQVTFARIPAGRYMVHANGSVKALQIDVPGGPYVLEARVIDCARVAISDKSGVLYRAGLRPGDLVTSIDGTSLSASNWWQVLNEQGRKKGTRLTLIRDGREMTLQAGDHAWNGDDVGGTYAPANSAGDS